MITPIQYTGSADTLICKAVALAMVGVATFVPGWAVSDETEPQTAPLIGDSNELMSEEYRSSVQKIVVLPGKAPASEAITGSYEKETLGLIDGIAVGKGYGVYSKDIGGIPINFPIRVLTVPGGIIGGLIGASTRQVQDFRDALTAELVDAADSELSNDALATDVFWRLREVPSLKPKVFALTTPIPEDTEAILYVSFSASTIDIQKNDAVLTMSAMATLRRLSDGQDLYENQVHYQDKDTLENWVKNDNAAWRDYANFARHYLGRELSAELFERVEVQHELLPRKSDTVALVKKDAWRGVSKTTRPTLAWELTLGDDDSQAAWAKGIDAADIAYEVEIYDTHQLVYAAKKIQESRFTLDMELEACRTYRWSVRPSYQIDGDTRFGEWMRSNPDVANGNIGTAASEAAAYIYDFASLEIKCSRR